MTFRPREGPCLLHARPRTCARSSSSCSAPPSCARRRGPHTPTTAASGWLRPVDGAVVHPFDEPATVYGPGHRGADLAAPPGTPVRAANDGVVSFAGSVAGTLHVTVGARRRAAHLVLVPRLGRGARRSGGGRGDVLGTTGGTGPDHDGTVSCTSGCASVTATSTRCSSSARATSPSSSTSSRPTSRPRHRGRRPGAARPPHVAAPPRPGPAPGAGGAASAVTDDDACDTDLPLIGDAVDAACDVGAWVGDHADAAGRRRHRLPRRDHRSRVRRARRPARVGPRHGRPRCARSPTRRPRALARTPAGQVALDVVAIGRRFADTVTADCSDDAPDADGTGGSAHRVMVVAGINSEGKAWDRGPTVELDVDALGYHADEGEVRYYSYAADGGPYTARRHPPPDPRVGGTARRAAAARCSASSRAARSTCSPTRRVGWSSTRSSCTSTAPATGRSRRSATSSRCRRRTRARRSRPRANRSGVGGRAARARRARVGVVDAAAEQRRGARPRGGLVGGRGASSARACPTTSTSPPSAPPKTSWCRPPTSRCRGATETVAAVDGFNEHSAIVRAPDALRAVRAALEGRPPPCVGLATALRAAVAPVLISRVEHTAGSDAATLLGSPPPP